MGVDCGCRAALWMVSFMLDADIPAEQLYERTTLELLRYPVAGPLDHHALAAFLAALRLARVEQAARIVVTGMVDGDKGGKLRTRDLRLHLLLQTLGRVVYETVARPSQLRRQLELWRPHAENWGRHAELMKQLFP